MAKYLERGFLSAILAPAFIALSIIIANMLGGQLHPLLIAGIGSVASVVVLGPLYFIFKNKLSTKILFTKLRLPFAKLVATRAFLGALLIVVGFTQTTAVKAVLLLRLEPLFVLLWSVLLLKERPTISKFMLVMGLLVGSVFIVSPTDPISRINWGDCCIMLALLSLSYGYIPTQKVVKEAGPYGVNLYSNFIGGVLILLVSIPFLSRSHFVVSTTTWGLLAGYVLSFYVIGATLYFYAFKTVKPWIVASCLSLEVVVGLLLAVYVVGNTITIMQLVGTVIVVVATLGIAKISPHQ